MLRSAVFAVLVVLLCGGGWVAAVNVKPASAWFAPVVLPLIGDRWAVWERWRVPRPPYPLNEEDAAALSAAQAVIAERAAAVHRVRLTDADGRPVPAGTAVGFRLTRHAFGFGNFDDPSAQLEGLWGKRRNQSYALNLWTSIYREDTDTFDFRETEARAPAEWERAVGLEVAWHNLVWVMDYKAEPNGSDEYRVPAMMTELDFEAQREQILRWVRRAAEQAQGRYDVVNVFNEPLNDWTDPYGWGDPRRRQMLADVVREFRAHNTTSEVQVSIGEALTARDGMAADWLLAWVAAEGVPIDRFALQVWCNGVFNWGDYMPTLRLGEMRERLERLAAYGYPLDITEFQAPGSGSPEVFWSWNRERQADWTEAVATVAFGTPGVESFCYFRSRENFMVDGGLYEDGEPTLAADRLMGLIDGWTSAGTAVVGDDGVVELVGFPGVYDITPQDGQGGEGTFWRVDTEDEADGLPEAQAQPVPEPAPASIANLGPFVTAEHYLDALVEPLTGPLDKDDLPGVDAMADIAPLAWEHGGIEWEALEREGGTWVIGSRPVSGFCFDAVPAGAETLELELEVIDRGVPLSFNLFDRTKRYSDAALPPGRYRIRVPLTEGSRPVLHLIVRVGDVKTYHPGGGVRLPSAVLHAARFLGG